jgi:alanyl-tRNA synthetase
MSRSSEQVRSAYLEFFRKNGHEVVPSGPVIAPNDPTLMFANAGMVQFKDVFTGREERPYVRATTSQKCIRISGKHNDLENVGPSPRHHTFFEMLGNFSFGDYFKEEAIAFAWAFVQELGLPKERLAVTYFGGEQGIPPDHSARDLWKKIANLPDERVIPCGMSENFWSMGDTGPCGPCSEIHFFQGPKPDPALFGQEQTVEGFGWIEIWNLVFMQFNRQSGGKLDPLPKPSIDTGMGLERISTILQNKTSNYDTDLLRALVEKAATLAGKKYGGSMAPDDVSMRVIADHARLTAFCLAEGIMPDTNGRSYVLRRVMRRAIRHGHRLGIVRPFLHEVSAEVIRLMGSQYAELIEKSEHIAVVCEQEEVRFRRTIERGLTLLDERFVELEASRARTLAGADAFKLHDTFGFPLDLTEVICRERGFEVDQAGYDAALNAAREKSEFKGAERAVEGVYREALEKVPSGDVRFSGYEQQAEPSPLLAIIYEGQLVSELAAPATGEALEAELVFASTPFYGEAGGQIGDTGTVTTENAHFAVQDTQRPIAGLVVHRGTLLRGQLRVSDVAELQVDEERREAIRRNHSATHLLHWALRKMLGGHAQQKGSLVGPERLRFDFTHGQALSKEQLVAIEDLANAEILKNQPVRTESMSMSDAKERGAMMLFGEKYGERVRVLTMGDSVELCGGTHARATGDIGMLKVISEQGVAAGVRRITATSGAGALKYLRELEHTLERAAELTKAGNLDLPTRIEKMLANERALEKKLAETQKKLVTGNAQGGVDALLSQAREYNGIKVLSVRCEVTERAALRELAEQLRDRLGPSVVLVASQADGNAQLVLTVAKALTSKLQAGQLIRPIAEIVGGSGGGRPDLAQAGGTQPQHIDDAVQALHTLVEPLARAL